MCRRRNLWTWLVCFLFFGLIPNLVYAQGDSAIPKIDKSDTGFVLMSAALVLLMTPGLAIFYGGMVRRKNILGVLMQCFTVMCVISIQWMFFGYSLSFAPHAGFWGGFTWFGLMGVGIDPHPSYGPTIPHLAFMVFQLMFAIITPALIIGAVAERMKFSAFLLFTILWATFIYDPLTHWVWGDGGWLKNMGLLDFAGGTVVEINSGFSALAAALCMGRRRGYDNKPYPPHNLPFTVLGAGLLWFGWYGFNAGSALAADGLATMAFVTTNMAAASAGLTWAIIEWFRNGKPTMFGTVTGVVAGMVAITPAAGFVNPVHAVLIGILASIFCFMAVSIIKPKLGYDDSLDVFGIHGIGGIVGTLGTGLFASKLINPAGGEGLVYGHSDVFITQAVAVGVTIGFSFVGTTLIMKFIDLLVGLRVSEREEIIGLDLTQHNEGAYTVLD